MRRKDRELDFNAGLDIIDKCVYGVISCKNGDEIFSIPISVARQDKSVYIHGAKSGSKNKLLKDGVDVLLLCVCDAVVPKFSQDDIKHAVSQNKAASIFTTEYKSVIAKCKVYEVREDNAKISALKILCEKYTPNYLEAFDSAILQSLAQTKVYELRIQSLNAKAKILAT
ncbi:MAG: pyridoxamine 5'-phosphate oxidase family protein [Campylobacter sp.]|nr:pyridoxamine 5'-phosphate oxidase family protein [Campylobacter sp.]